MSTEADVGLTDDLAVRATAARNDTQLLFRLNGATRSYSPDPRGTDLSASVIYSYRPSAEIKTFVIDRSSALGIAVNDPSFDGGYSADVRSSMVQVSHFVGSIPQTAADQGFGQAMEHASAGTPLKRIFVRDRGCIVPIMVKEIERLEADDDYVAVHVRGRFSSISR